MTAIKTTVNVQKDSKKEIEIKFITDLSEEYQPQQSTFTLPLNCTVDKLNDLLNKLIKKKKKFSFFINNIKITSTLAEFVNQNLISTENVIEVYYIFELNEPQLKNTIKEDEWIRKIEVIKEMKYDPMKYKEYCVGMFNGVVSFYNDSDKKEFSIENMHQVDKDALALLTDIKFFKRSESNNNILIRTMKNSDYTFDIYDVNIKNMQSNLLFSNKKYNDEYFTCISLNNANFDMFFLGGTENDKGIAKLFKIPLLNINQKSNIKKRKIASSNLEPILTFDNLHNKTVECCSWLNEEQILIGGDDFTLNLFNINTRNLFMTYNTNYKNVTCFLPMSQKTFLAGYQDGTIKYYDIKTPNKSLLQFKDKAFCGYISEMSISNDKENYPNTFVSSGYDSYLKIWDVRGGNVPLCKMKTNSTEKNYSVKFNGNNKIISGGDGSEVNIFSF